MRADTETRTSGRAPLTPEERAAAFAAGVPRISRRVIAIAVAALAVLGLGGVGSERLFSNSGLNPGSGSSPAAGATTAPSDTSSALQIASSLAQFMGVVRLTPTVAPRIQLADQFGRTFSIAQARGRVVVLSFFDSRCDDLCPVLASELTQADAELGAAAGHVVFLTVNTDPLATSISPSDPAVAQNGLSSLSNWRLLSGPLPALDTVWRAYGVSINVSPTTNVVAHNDVLYFIDARGRLRMRATPFGNESPSGTFSLAPASVARWAHGIATYAASLLPETR